MYVVVGSVTTAVRFKRLLEKKTGFPAQVVHTPVQIKRGGCSYSVIADDRLQGQIRPFCAEHDIMIQGIYVKEGEGFYAVSG